MTAHEGPARLVAALADRYRIERELGQGGMATVYLAHDLKHDRQVAIKVLRPELAAVIGAERFVREIRTIAALQHPHILGLIDSGSVADRRSQVESDSPSAFDLEPSTVVYYVMPFVEGESLRDRLKREKQLPVADAVRIASEVAAALDYAHRHGVIHRDIKPENILLHDGSALVADFGIALAVSGAGGARMTETGMSLGTPHYMSPEQAMGEREITARSDIYALGAMTYEMLVGDPPFTGSTAQAIVAKVVTETPRPMLPQRHTIPPHVEAAVLTALEKLPADRFASAAEFAEALRNPGYRREAVAASGKLPAFPPSRVSAILIAALVLVAALAAWGWLGRGRNEATQWAYVSLSDSIAVSTNSYSLAISADGSMLAFKDGAQNGLIWIKRRNRLDPTPIPGTERGSGMTFSPDGAWLAFTQDGHIKRVRPDGGSAVVLADSSLSSIYNVVWLSDGTLIYTGATQDRLYRVSSAGGEATPVLADSSLSGYGLVNLAALPQARGVLFTSCTSGCVTSDLRVLDLETGAQKLLQRDIMAGWYAPGDLLLTLRRDGTVLAAPFDLGKLEITGAAVPVLDHVMLPAGGPLLTFSASGTLAYLRGSATSGERQVVRVDRSGLDTVVDSAWIGPFNSSALSPDGRRMAVGVGAGAGGLSIWVKELDRGPFSRLTFGGGDRRPAWSADGRMIAYVRDEGNGGRIYGRPSDGSGADRALAVADRPVQEVTWSPDGRWLVVRTDNGTAGAGDILGIPLQGDSTPVPLVASPFTELHPAISPDSRWLAYTSNESGDTEVYVRSFPNTAGSRRQISNGGGVEPVWSHDGTELFYLNPNSARLMAAQVRTGEDFSVTAVHPLFDVSRFQIDPFHQSFSVETDGRHFLFSQSQAGTGAAPRMVMAQHWFADVRARMKQ